MNTIPVSEEMKARIQPYFNDETRRYDVDAIREAQYEQDDDPLGLDTTFGNFFGGHEDEQPQHTMLSAAVQLNEELDAQDEAVQNTDDLVQAVVDMDFSDDDRDGDQTVRTRWNRLTLENQRRFVQHLLQVLEAAQAKLQDKSLSRTEKSRAAAINNRILYCLTHQIKLADDEGGNDHVQSTSVNLQRARRFVRGAEDRPLFTRLPEEYLAEMGL